MKRSGAVAAAVLWMGAIFSASSVPGSATGPNTPEWTFFLKVLHFVNFGVLAVLFLFVTGGGAKRGRLPAAVYAASFLLAVLYAAGDEYHQAFTPGRHPSARDVLIDSLGAVVFLSAAYLAGRIGITRHPGRPPKAGAEGPRRVRGGSGRRG